MGSAGGKWLLVCFCLKTATKAWHGSRPHPALRGSAGHGWGLFPFLFIHPVMAGCPLGPQDCPSSCLPAQGTKLLRRQVKNKCIQDAQGQSPNSHHHPPMAITALHKVPGTCPARALATPPYKPPTTGELRPLRSRRGNGDTDSSLDPNEEEEPAPEAGLAPKSAPQSAPLVPARKLTPKTYHRAFRRHRILT